MLRDLRPRVRACAAVALIAAAAPSIGRAQPAGPADAPSDTPEIARAKDLYRSAETELAAGQIDAALRHYQLSYDLSKDPALLYKIGHAYELSGKCEVALRYYQRYLREGKPGEPYIATTNERITACGGQPQPSEPVPPAAPAQPAKPAPPAPADQPNPPEQPASPLQAAHAAEARPAQPAITATPSNSHKIAWLATGSGIALAALGGVLAYAASSSENDVRDLYVGLNNTPPSFDATTRNRYNDFVNQGHNYEHLSWTSFGLAGAAAVTAALLFTLGGHDEPTGRISASPGGLAVRF